MTTRLGFALGLASALIPLTGASCTRREIEAGLDRAHVGSRELVRRVDEGFDQAKQEADHIKAKLPAPETVEVELGEAKESLKSKLDVARVRVQAGVDHARQAMR